MTTIRNTSILAVAVSMAISAHVNAQRSTTTQIEEVVVTAQKREENMQDVAISMSAMDANAIEKSFARTIDDITGMSPNLIINPILGNGTVGVSIRGMQHAEVEKSFDPAVAIYQDGIYLSSTTGALRNMWDAERIEVLRGPQGTLFGRNTIGGLVHVIRSKPTGEWGGKLVGTFAQDSQTDLKGLINLPEMGGVSVKLSAASIRGGEYFYNATRNEEEGENDLLMMTADVLFEPSDNFNFRVIYDYIDDDTPTRPLSAIIAPGEGFYGLACINPATGADSGECLGGVNRSDDDLYTVYSSYDQYSELRTDALTIHANWQISDSHRLAFVFGDRETEEQAFNEFDGTSTDVFWTDRPTLENQTSYEFRLESDWSDSLRSTVGLFLWESDYTLQQNTGILNNINPTPVTNYSASPLYSQEVESTAVFGQVDWDVTDRLMLSAGGRWLDEEKEACMTVTGYPVNPLQTLLGLPEGSVAYTDISGRDKTLDPYPYLLGGTVQGAAWGANCPSWAASVYDDSFDGTASWDEFTPRFAAQYSFDSGMAYITYSEGFRSGGFNGRATAPDNTGPYDPESVESWEAGAKFTMFDNRFQLNLAAFTIEYNDKQEDIVKPGTDGQATLTVVQNASTATMEGLEMDFTWVIAEGLSLRGNVGLLDASFDDFMTSSATGMVDLSSIALRRAPDMTAGLGLLFERQMAEGHFFVATVNYTWKDDYYISASTNGGDKTIPAAQGGAGFADNPSLVDAFGILDASINWETENWTLSLFGKNLTDETYLMSFLDVGGNVVATGAGNPTPVYAPGAWSFGTPNRPRYFGAEITLKF